MEKHYKFCIRFDYILDSVTIYRVFTTLKNMAISGNLLILENLGNLKYTWGILVYQMLFLVMQSETHNKPTCKFLQLQWFLCHHDA